MVSKRITLIAKTTTFNENVHEWRQQSTNMNTWLTFKNFSRQSHQEQQRAATTAEKGWYTAAVKNIYGVPLPPPTRRSSWGNRVHTWHHSEDEIPALRDGWNVIGQCGPDQYHLISDGTTGTTHFNHGSNASLTQDPLINSNKKSNDTTDKRGAL